MIISIGDTTINTRNVAYAEKIYKQYDFVPNYIRITFHSGAFKEIRFSSERQRNEEFNYLIFWLNEDN